MSTDNQNDVPLAADDAVGGDAALLADGTAVSGEPQPGEPLPGDDADGALLDEVPVAAPPSGKRFLLALLVGLALAVLSGIAWAVAVEETGKRWAVVAVVFGLLIGHLMRRISGRTSVGVATAAALLAVLGTTLGSWLEVYVAFGNAVPLEIGFRRAYEILGVGSRTWNEFVDRLDWITYLTWGLAALSAFVYAFDSGRKKQVEVLEAQVAGPAGETGADETVDVAADAAAPAASPEPAASDQPTTRDEPAARD